VANGRLRTAPICTRAGARRIAVTQNEAIQSGLWFVLSRLD
jgi:hypothetical protein